MKQRSYDILTTAEDIVAIVATWTTTTSKNTSRTKNRIDYEPIFLSSCTIADLFYLDMRLNIETLV